MKTKGEYRNLKPMESNPALFQFEVKLKSGEWRLMTHVCIDNDADRRTFAQNTADGWRKK